MKGKPYFEMRTLSPTFNLGFLNCRSGFAVQKGQKVGILYIFWYQVYRAIFSRVYYCNELSQFVIVLVSIVFLVTVRYIFQRSYCTFSKCSLGLTHCRVNLYSFSFALLFKHSSKFCPLVNTNFFGSIFFCNPSQKCTNSFLRIF